MLLLVFDMIGFYSTEGEVYVQYSSLSHPLFWSIPPAPIDSAVEV